MVECIGISVIEYDFVMMNICCICDCRQHEKRLCLNRGESALYCEWYKMGKVIIEMCYNVYGSKSI